MVWCVRWVFFLVFVKRFLRKYEPFLKHSLLKQRFIDWIEQSANKNYKIKCSDTPHHLVSRFLNVNSWKLRRIFCENNHQFLYYNFVLLRLIAVSHLGSSQLTEFWTALIFRRKVFSNMNLTLRWKFKITQSVFHGWITERIKLITHTIKLDWNYFLVGFLHKFPAHKFWKISKCFHINQPYFW